MKNSIITPIYKTGDRRNPGNYRPIAILNSFSKIIEKTINNRIIKFIDGKNKILNDNQYAYRRERSIQDVLYELIEEINNNLENNYVTATLFLDIKKAYDSVNHEILLEKMNRIGIRGKGGELMKSYLLNRTQEVKVNNSVISDKKNVKSGVPQGSTLGSTMFIIYTNDLGKREDDDGITLKFADDTATSKSGKEVKITIDKLQKKITELDKWFANNGIEINEKKSNLIISAPEGKNNKEQIENSEIRINDQRITHTTTTKYLGMIIDAKLNWNAQIEKVVENLSLMIKMVWNIKNKINDKNKKQIYHALIESKLIHSVGIWGSTTKTNMEKVQRKMNIILRILFNKERKENIEIWMKENKIMNCYAMYLNNITKKAWKTIRNEQRGRIILDEKERKEGSICTRANEITQIEVKRWKTNRGKRANVKRMAEVANKLEKKIGMITRAKKRKNILKKK